MTDNAVTAMDATVKNASVNDLIEKIRQQALADRVPIIQDEGRLFLEDWIFRTKPRKILEIGTAVGYSAIFMNQVCHSEIYTIERNEKMFQTALKNLRCLPSGKEIHLIFKDALEAFSDLADQTFDLIFIDAAKAQYQKFFDLYTPLLSAGGTVICDNMDFHGLVENPDSEHLSRSVRGLVRKLQSFRSYLQSHPEFETTFFHIGDGISVSEKK